METPNLNKVAALLKDKAKLIEVANACDLAYAIGTGNPDWHTPFGEENSEKVACNLAGLYAVIGAIGTMHSVHGEPITNMEPDYPDILADIIKWDAINGTCQNILLRMANTAWSATQAFRSDRGMLSRAGNVFDLLPAEEVEKDRHQIQAAAKYLLEYLRAE